MATSDPDEESVFISENQEHTDSPGLDGGESIATRVAPAAGHKLLWQDLRMPEQAEPLGRWPSQYENKLISADEAAYKVLSGQRVYVGGNSGEPVLLVQALMKRANTLSKVEIVRGMALGPLPCLEPGQSAAFRHNALHSGHGAREAINEGLADYTPVSTYQAPRLFRDHTLKIDVAFISVSPPDAQGYCSYGVEVGLTRAAAESAHMVMAEVNPYMPRVWGNSFIHLSQINFCVPVAYPLADLPAAEQNPVYQQIGEYVAGLIEDGSTLQVGSGAIHEAVLSSLRGKYDLGLHTETLPEGIVDLVQRGVINGRRKSFLPGKIVGSSARGTRRLYDFVRDNPTVEMYPVEFTNDPHVIARNDKMVAITSALQVDLTGQVCADPRGVYTYSGVGEQADFMRGAALSNGGKPIVALPSTALEGMISRVVSNFDPGASVSFTRNDVYYVVTEYGVASLFGRTARRRAEELISIAHPDFRAELRAAARQRHLL